MIVDGSGKPMKMSGACPKCGASEDHRETHNGFGGHTQTVCNLCGLVFEETHPPRKEAS